MYHFRQTRLRYAGYPKSNDCHFCEPKQYDERIILETKHCYVMPNRTFYDLWELRRVVDHLLLIPKRHVLQLSELTRPERAGLMDILADYEAAGYEIYARSRGSATRSVGHQHTHLIKTEAKQGRGLFYWRKPYWLIKF